MKFETLTSKIAEGTINCVQVVWWENYKEKKKNWNKKFPRNKQRLTQNIAYLQRNHKLMAHKEHGPIIPTVLICKIIRRHKLWQILSENKNELKHSKNKFEEQIVQTEN